MKFLDLKRINHVSHEEWVIKKVKCKELIFSSSRKINCQSGVRNKENLLVFQLAINPSMVGLGPNGLQWEKYVITNL